MNHNDLNVLNLAKFYDSGIGKKKTKQHQNKFNAYLHKESVSIALN